MNKMLNPIEKYKNENPAPKKKTREINNVHPKDYTAKHYAELFVKNLDDTKRSKLKNMMQMGVECCRNIANMYKIPYDDFINELKTVI